MIEQAGPPSKQIQATKQVQEFLKDGDDVIIIGVFSGENDKAYQLYQEAGKEFFLKVNESGAEILPRTLGMDRSFISALSLVKEVGEKEEQGDSRVISYLYSKKLAADFETIAKASASNRKYSFGIASQKTRKLERRENS